MNKPCTLPRSRKVILEAVSAIFIFATLSFNLYTFSQQGCRFLDSPIGWLAIEILRPVIALVCHIFPCNLSAVSNFVQHASHLVVSASPLLCALIMR